MKTILIISFFILTSSLANAVVNGTPTLGIACAREITVSACNTGRVRRSLAKCFRRFKKVNPAFNISEPCEQALKEFRINLNADAQALVVACTKEAATAECGNLKVSTGLLSCIKNYEKKHNNYKISAPCQAAFNQINYDRNASNLNFPSNATF